jgi:chorismate mutase
MNVRAIRGATTINVNEREDILNETKKLLLEIKKANKLNMDDVISIIFTVTEDVDSVFPAFAAREMGWTDLPLLCTREIDVPGSLKKCIRVLLHVNSDKTNKDMKHIYLKEAVKLRPDINK